LTGLILPELKVVCVPSRRDYSNGKKQVATYDVQDGVLAFS
jgi:hypothetical protein